MRHWPESYATVNKNGDHRPINPPSVFTVTPNSFLAQTINNESRRCSERRNDYDSRQSNLVCAEIVSGPSNKINQ